MAGFCLLWRRDLFLKFSGHVIVPRWSVLDNNHILIFVFHFRNSNPNLRGSFPQHLGEMFGTYKRKEKSYKMILRFTVKKPVHHMGGDKKDTRHRSVCPSELLGKHVGRFARWVRECAIEKFKVSMPAMSVTLEWGSHLAWWTLKWPNAKIFKDESKETVISILS